MFGLERGPRLDALRDALTEVLSFSESPLSVLPVMQRALRRTPTMTALPRRRWTGPTS